MTPSRLLAFVRPELDCGPILAADGEFIEECRAIGAWDISDNNMTTPTAWGLQVYEGWLERAAGDDGDVTFVGAWRQLTHWEMCRVRFGMSPFVEEP